MLTRSMKRLWRWHWAAAACAVLAMVDLAAGPAAAAEAAKLPASLELVPENAAFYSSMLRNREQFEAIANSRAWAKLKAMPVVQMGMALYNLQAANPDSPPGRLQTALQDPEVQKDLSLLGDLVSDEVFCLRRPEHGRFRGPGAAAGRGHALRPDRHAAQRQGPRMFRPTKFRRWCFCRRWPRTPQLLKVPDVVLGFKVHDAAAVKQRLERLEKQANALP